MRLGLCGNGLDVGATVGTAQGRGDVLYVSFVLCTRLGLEEGEGEGE